MKVLNLTGERYGQLLVTRKAETVGKFSRWECQCDCGEKIIATSQALRHDHKVNCGGPKHHKEIGKRYGMLTVIGVDKPICGRKAYRCRCDCGTEATFQADPITKGNRKSCGCLKERVTKKPAMRFYGSESCLLARVW